MTHSISILQIALDTARHNEPIIRSEGRVEEADRVRREIDDLLYGLSALQCIKDGYLDEPDTFEGKLAQVINCHSKESGSNTPDFILAEYLKRCLENFDLTMAHRETWNAPRPIDGEVPVTPEYRLLDEGEVIEEGDEVLRGAEWEPTGLAPGHRIQGFSKYRRRITP